MFSRHQTSSSRRMTSLSRAKAVHLSIISPCVRPVLCCTSRIRRYVSAGIRTSWLLKGGSGRGMRITNLSFCDAIRSEPPIPADQQQRLHTVPALGQASSVPGISVTAPATEGPSRRPSGPQPRSAVDLSCMRGRSPPVWPVGPATVEGMTVVVPLVHMQ